MGEIQTNPSQDASLPAVRATHDVALSTEMLDQAEVRLIADFFLLLDKWDIVIENSTNDPEANP